MAKCPWLKGGCCSQCSMHGIYAATGGKPGICNGQQINGKRYTDCQYYVNPKQFATGNTRPCPYCDRREEKHRYYAYCMSNKHPYADGVNPVYIRDDNQGGICIGRQINKKKYTDCSYYKGASKIKGISNSPKSSSNRKKSTGSNDGDNISGNKLGGVLFCFLVAWVAIKGTGNIMIGIISLLIGIFLLLLMIKDN